MSRLSSGIRRVAWGVLPMLILGLGLGGMFALASRRLEPQKIRNIVEPPRVKTVAITPHSGGLDLELDGVVTPYREITLAAEVSGRVVRKSENCRAGRFVTRGELLLEIDPQDYELEILRLERQLAQAEANLEDQAVEQANTEALIASANEELALQKVELKRVEKLRGAVSDSDADKARRAEWASRNALITLNNQIQLLKSRRRGLEIARDLVQTQLDKARLDLKRTAIHAPVDGLIVRDDVEQDSFVQKGEELFTVEDTSRVEVRCNLQMDDLTWIWQQSAVDEAAAVGPTSASITADNAARSEPNLLRIASSYQLPPVAVTVAFQPVNGHAKYKWRGTLSRFEGAGLDEKTRTVPCRVQVPDPHSVVVEGAAGLTSRGPKALLRGMYVQVIVHTDPQPPLLRIPEIAVQPDKHVLRVRNGTLEFVGPVVLARRIDEFVSPSGTRKSFLVPASPLGLQPGDHVIDSPLIQAQPGMKVREELETESDAVEMKSPSNPQAQATPCSDDVLF